jgi:hypothetical protein
MVISIPKVTKAERTNALLFFFLTLLPAIVFFFLDKIFLIGFLTCIGLRYVELIIVNKYGDKLQ